MIFNIYEVIFFQLRIHIKINFLPRTSLCDALAQGEYGRTTEDGMQGMRRHGGMAHDDGGHTQAVDSTAWVAVAAPR